MSARVLCFASAKGGSGKTVITATIGTFLKALGKRVLLIDADAATNGLTLLYIKEVLSSKDTLDGSRILEGLFEGRNEGYPDVFPLPSGVDFVPATYHFVNTEAYEKDNFVARLDRTLDRHRRDYDYILLDAQAGSDFCASVAIRKGVSDLVILVAEYDPMSSAGVERLKALFRDDLTYARTWILLNKILPEFAKNFGDFLEVARYLSPIPWDADVVRAYARRRLALDTENGNAFTVAVMQTVRGLLGNEIEADIKLWAEKRADAIRQPIKTQYDDLERELGVILEQSAVAEFYASKKSAYLERIDLLIPLAGVILAIGSSGFALLVRPEHSALTAVLAASASVAGALMLGRLVKFFLVTRRSTTTTASMLDLAKLRRRREVIEEHLKKLETLRTADPESLLRNRKNSE